MDDVGLLGDILILLGAFSLGFVAGVVFMPLRRVVLGFWNAPGRLLKGTQDVGSKLRQAFRSGSGEEAFDRTSLTGSVAGAVSDVLTLRVRHAETSFRAGVEAFDAGNYELARRRFSAAIFWDRGLELKPLHVLAHQRLGWLDEQRGAWECAREHYQQAVRLDKDSLPATLRLGMMYFRLGETGPAIFQFQRALELDPGNLDTHYHLYAIYRQAGMEREALEQLRIVKAGESAAKLAELFSRHGDDHFRMGRHDEAASDYALALQFDPQRVPLYLALGDLYYIQQQPHTALETWCRGLWADWSEALAERVFATAGGEVDIWSAIQLVRDCLSRHVQDGRYCFLLSRLLRRVGEEEESNTLLAEAVRLSPQLLEAQQELGDVYSCVGQHAKAQAAYRDGVHAARVRETVYRCRQCAYITQEEQPRCFNCNRWGTLEPMPRGAAEGRGLASRTLRSQAASLRRSLRAAWTKIAGQLPEGGHATIQQRQRE